MVEYTKLVVGQLQTNCYLIWEETTKEAVVIDPGDEADFISDEIEKRGLKLIEILLTHSHGDHTGAVEDLRLMYKINILNQAPFGLETIKTPGHTTDSVCFYNKGLGVVFTGDTLFKDLPTRNENLESIKKLLKLPEETLVLPGHEEETTIGAEARRY